MKYSIALSVDLHDALCRHLARADGQEDLCFAVWFPSRGNTRTTALLHAAVFPTRGDRAVHGNVEFFPPYFERALGAALAAGGGLAFLHSHPASGWQRMSTPDVEAESGMAAAVLAATDLPLLGLTLGARDRTWSGRLWEKSGSRSYSCEWVESVRVVGSMLSVSFNDDLLPVPAGSVRQQRTVSAWGPRRQAALARLHIGIVGLGNVGGIVAEALARIGVQHVTLLDFDSIEDVNLDRALFATPEDVGKAKVAVVADRISKYRVAGSMNVAAHEFSVCEDEGFRRILDCDVVFCCVDRPWPRSILNFTAYAHLIPVIDGGVRVSRTQTDYRGAEWRAHTVSHDQRCLRCLGQYDPALVAVEQTGHLADPAYIESLPHEHPLRGSENVFAFGLAAGSLEILQLIMLVVGPSSSGVPGPQTYHLTLGTIDIDERPCDGDCEFPGLVAMGEAAGHPGTARHESAERARASRQSKPPRPRGHRLARWARRVMAQLMTPHESKRERKEV